jgi:selenocysteine lyase/cysteine desulfurase
MGEGDFPESDIRSRVHSGTVNFATVLTVPTALALHQEIGAAARQARLRHSRDYWVSRVRGFKDSEILTPDEAGSYARSRPSVSPARPARPTTRPSLRSFGTATAS